MDIIICNIDTFRREKYEDEITFFNVLEFK